MTITDDEDDGITHTEIWLALRGLSEDIAELRDEVREFARGCDARLTALEEVTR